MRSASTPWPVASRGGDVRGELLTVFHNGLDEAPLHGGVGDHRLAEHGHLERARVADLTPDEAS